MILLGLLGGSSEPVPVSPAIRSIVAHADRTATPLRVTAAGAFATFFQPYSAGDQNEWTIDLSKFLYADEALDTIISLTPSLAMTSLSIAIDDGDRRPAIDRDNKLVQFYLTSDPSSLTSFSGAGVTVTAEIVFTTSGTRPNRYHKLISMTARTS